METNDKAAPAADRKEVLVLLAPEKVNTLVIMDVPEGPLLFCQLEDLTLKPERGSSYVLDGQLYDVERAVEVIGVYKSGSHLSTDQQLLSLLNLLCGQEQAPLRVGSMRNIGKPAGASALSGGLILAKSVSMTAGADRLVFLKLRHVRTTSATDGMVQLARQTLDREVGSGSKKGQE
jgi:hypothetical protein